VNPRAYVLIVNPVSGGGRGRRVLERALPVIRDHGIEPHVVVCGDSDEPAAAARTAAADGAGVVVAVGGDGHAAAVAEGLIGTDTSLALLPAGSANDYAKSLGMPRHDVATAVDYIARNRVTRVDTLRVANARGSRHFLNVVGSGFDAEVAVHAERIPYLRGPGRYVLAIMRVLPGFAPAVFQVDVDGAQLETRAMMVAVANGTSYGGGMHIAPQAKLDSGELEICIVGDVGRLEFVRAFPRVFRGTHTDHPKVTMLRGRRVLVDADRPLSVIGDGELWGQLPVEVEVAPGSLSVVVGGREHRTGALD